MGQSQCAVCKCTVQVMRPLLLRAGFELVQSKGLEVTDDVSIIEALGEPVQITAGSYTNIKVGSCSCWWVICHQQRVLIVQVDMAADNLMVPALQNAELAQSALGNSCAAKASAYITSNKYIPCPDE